MPTSDETIDDAPTLPDGGVAMSAGRSGPRSRVWLAGIVVGAVALALLVVLGGMVAARAGTALPGTFVEGTDVGGLGEDGVRSSIGTEPM